MKTSIADTLELITRKEVREKIKKANSAVPALPLLDYTLEEIQAIEEALPPEAQIKDIMRTAMISPSGHWATYALEWIIQGFPVDDDIVEWFEVAKENKRIPQRVRQYSGKIVTNYKFKNTQPGVGGNA